MDPRFEKEAWMAVPQFGGWDQKSGAPDYSMVFQRARANRKQHKTEVKRQSVGCEDELIAYHRRFNDIPELPETQKAGKIQPASLEIIPLRNVEYTKERLDERKFSSCMQAVPSMGDSEKKEVSALLLYCGLILLVLSCSIAFQ